MYQQSDVPTMITTDFGAAVSARAHKAIFRQGTAIAIMALAIVVLAFAFWQNNQRLSALDDLTNIMLPGIGGRPLSEAAIDAPEAYAESIVGYLGNISSDTVEAVVANIQGELHPEKKYYFSVMMAPEVERIKKSSIYISTENPQSRFIQQVNLVGRRLYKVIVRAHQVIHIGGMEPLKREIDVELLVQPMPFSQGLKWGVRDIRFPRVLTEDGKVIDALIKDQ